MQNNDQWSVRIPDNIAPGNYVLRHEILALHGASSPNGAQSYPQCINLEITGSGSSSPAGTAGTSLLSANDPGVLYNVWQAASSYPVPGGPIVAGGTSMIPQSVVRPTATGTVTPAGGSAPPPTTQGPGPSPPAPTTIRTTTTQAPSTGGAAHWGQCGGQNWSGPTSCVSGATCTVLNPHYSQCIPN